MLPPRPPSPPSGPPRGMDRARRNDAEPSPPFPAITSILASTKNFIDVRPLKRKSPARRRGSFGFEEPSGLRRLDRYGALAVGSVLGVLHLAGHEREKRVVLADA